MSKKLKKSKFSLGKWDFKENKEKQGDMFLKSFYIGDTYADPFSKGIKSINYQLNLILDLATLKKINLSRCGLKDKGLIQIIKNAPNNLRELDISENSMLGMK